MNYNIIAYSIYLPIICFIMVKIGWLFYKNGEIFLLNLFPQNLDLVKSINTLLLAGYYLTNIGYAIITISYWEKLTSVTDIINTTTTTIGEIVILLALLHYNNIFWLRRLNTLNFLKQ